jgi:hypothetical protein
MHQFEIPHVLQGPPSWSVWTESGTAGTAGMHQFEIPHVLQGPPSWSVWTEPGTAGMAGTAGAQQFEILRALHVLLGWGRVSNPCYPRKSSSKARGSCGVEYSLAVAAVRVDLAVELGEHGSKKRPDGRFFAAQDSSLVAFEVWVVARLRIPSVALSLFFVISLDLALVGLHEPLDAG